MFSFRDYDIYLLFLLLVKFQGSGKREISSPIQRISQCFCKCAILLKLRNRKHRPFISERDVRQNDFRTPRWLSAVFLSENQDMMVRFQSRDK